MNKYERYYLNLKKYYYLFTLLVKRDIKKKYKGSFLGILWSLLNPLLQMIVLTIIFSTLFHGNIQNYPLYMITGRLTFEFFSSGTNTAMKSIFTSAALLKKVYIPKYITTISKITSNFIIFSISLIDLVLVMIFTGADFTINLIFLPVYLILLFLFTSGIGLILATVTTFFRDIEHIYSVFTMMLMYFSAIFYPVDIIPEKFQVLLNLNPLHHFISGLRQIVYYGATPEITNVLACFGIAVVSVTIGLTVFEKNQDKFILYI